MNNKFAWVEFLLKHIGSILTVGGLMVAVIVFFATLAPRLSNAESDNKRQDAEIIDLKGISQKFDGYAASNESTNKLLTEILKQQEQRQVPNQMMRQIPEPSPRYWTAYDEYGNLYCYNQETWWWPDEHGKCE